MESQDEIQAIDIVVIVPPAPDRDVVTEPWACLDKIIVDMHIVMGYYI